MVSDQDLLAHMYLSWVVVRSKVRVVVLYRE